MMDNDKSKETAGTVATFVWLATGLYLFSTTHQASFLSLNAIMFFVVGMFFAALILGGIIHLTMKGATKVMVASGVTSTPLLSMLGIGLALGQIALTGWAAHIVFHWMYS